MRKSVLVVASVAALAAIPAVASAQRARASSASASASALHFGAELNWGSANWAGFGIGARLTYGLGDLIPTLPLAVHASFDWFFPGNSVTLWEINGNVVYNFDVRTLPTVKPYLGAGLSFAHESGGGFSNNNLGFSAVGGARFKLASAKITPFAELRLDAHDNTQMVLTGGILF